MNTEMPQTPADCIDDIPLSQLHRCLIIARIEYLVTRRLHVMGLAAMEAHAEAMRAFVAPITTDEANKADDSPTH